MGTGLPLIGGGGTVEYLTNISGGQAYHENLTNISRGQAIPHEYLTNTRSCLFWGEFRPSQKFSNTFDVEIPHSGNEAVFIRLCDETTSVGVHNKDESVRFDGVLNEVWECLGFNCTTFRAMKFFLL